MRRHLIAAASVAAAFAPLPVLAASPSWDLVRDFSLVHNPNGAWKYSGNHTVMIYKTGRVTYAPGLEEYTDLQSPPDGAAIAHNTTSHPVSFDPGWGNVTVPTDHLLMQPQAGITNVFWTAPHDGTYTVTADFVALNASVDTHYTHVDLLGQYVRLADFSIYDHSHYDYSSTLTLRSGDTLNFTVQAGSDYRGNETGLSVQITEASTAQ